jgi:hypothetical protein
LCRAVAAVLLIPVVRGSFANLYCTAPQALKFPSFDCTVLFDSQSALFDLSEAYIKIVIIHSIYSEVGDQVVQFRVYISEFRRSAETDTYFVENRIWWTHMARPNSSYYVH